MRTNSANRLALQLGEQIIELCVASELEQGARLVERKLAAELGVSRSPIRAALKILEERGVVSRAGDGLALAMGHTALRGMSLDAPPPAGDALSLRILRDRFSGALPDQLNEADLLRTYGVTRSALTQALMRLNEDGYLSRSAGRGWVFAEILNSVEAYRASYEFRRAIEPAALSSPNYKIDKFRIQQLLDRHLELRGRKDEIDVATWIGLDAELHQMLADFSGNEFFRRAVRSQNHLRSIVEIESFYADERVKESLDEHIAILESLLRDDREWAATLLLRHLQLSCESIEVFADAIA